jgi:LPXTG-motif cell wall-anchored protein
MDSTTVAVLAGLVVVVALLGAFVARKRRSEDLKERFGPEYGHAVDTYGDKSRAESELAARAKRVEKLSIRPLDAPERERFSQRWQAAQTRFVDEPARAVTDASVLVKEVMQARGYPMGDFEQRAADISVDHPAVVSNYRAAREISQKNDSGSANTEDLRQAMVHYRVLFQELLQTAPEKELAR